jgi:hypothetical protein
VVYTFSFGPRWRSAESRTATIRANVASIPHGIDRTDADPRGRMYYDAIRFQMTADTRGEKRSGLRGGDGDFGVLSGV